MSEVFTSGTKHNLKPNKVRGEWHREPAKSIGKVSENSRSGEPFSGGTVKRMKSEHRCAEQSVGGKMDVSKPIKKKESTLNTPGTDKRRKSEIARSAHPASSKVILSSDTQQEENIDGDF